MTGYDDDSALLRKHKRKGMKTVQKRKPMCGRIAELVAGRLWRQNGLTIDFTSRTNDLGRGKTLNGKSAFTGGKNKIDIAADLLTERGT